MLVLEKTAGLLEALLQCLRDYDNPVSVYVRKILELLVKFFIAEDRQYLSERGAVRSAKLHRHMVLAEFGAGEEAEGGEVELLWTEMLYTYACPLYKHSILNTSLIVLQDHIASCSKKHEISEFNLKEKIARLNEEIEGNLPVTELFYQDLTSLGETINILVSCLGAENERSTKSTKKIMFSFLKSVLKSCRTDKIKALLDIKVVYYLIPYLLHPEPKLRRDLL
jgi:hypothetical protein